MGADWENVIRFARYDCYVKILIILVQLFILIFHFLAKLKRIIIEAFEETYKISEERKISFRTASYIIAVSRIAKAIQLRGIFP